MGVVAANVQSVSGCGTLDVLDFTDDPSPQGGSLPISEEDVESIPTASGSDYTAPICCWGQAGRVPYFGAE